MSLVDVRVLDFACPLISSFSKCFSSMMGDVSSHAQQLEFIGYHFDEPDDQTAYLKNHFVDCLERDFLFKPIKDSYNVVHLNKSFSNIANLRRRTLQSDGRPSGQVSSGKPKHAYYQSKIEPVMTDKQFLSPSGIEFSGLGFFGNGDHQRESLVINNKPNGGNPTPKRESFRIFEEQLKQNNQPTEHHSSARAISDQAEAQPPKGPAEEFTLRGTENSNKLRVERLSLKEETPPNHELKDSRHLFSEFPECSGMLTLDKSDDED